MGFIITGNADVIFLQIFIDFMLYYFSEIATWEKEIHVSHSCKISF